jgi:hypothetical protein
MKPTTSGRAAGWRWFTRPIEAGARRERRAADVGWLLSAQIWICADIETIEAEAKFSRGAFGHARDTAWSSTISMRPVVPAIAYSVSPTGIVLITAVDQSTL